MTQESDLGARGRQKGERDDDAGDLTWRDYLALFVAAVETVGLPLLVFIIVVLIVLAVARLFM